MNKNFNPSKRKIKPKQKIVVTPFTGRIPKHRSMDYSVNIHVNTLANLPKEASNIISATPYRLTTKGRTAKTWLYGIEKIYAIVSYPLNGKYMIDVPPTLMYNGKPMDMHIGQFFWWVAKAYKDEIYANDVKYGVWGHNITDLYFETVRVYKLKTKAYGIVEMGS